MFRKLMLGAVTASMVATPMLASEASAQSRREVTVERHGNHVTRTVVRQDRRGPAVRNVLRQSERRAWRKGQRFDRRYAQSYRVVDYRQYRGRNLYAPPRGYQWVRSGNDAVLVALASGLIGAVIGGALR